MSAVSARRGYIPAIDGLRAVAIVSVILFHLWPQALPGGFTGVDVFFVISGFVVTASVANRNFEKFGDLLLYFYARRLMRIMPALVAMLLAAILATNLFIPDAWLSASIPNVATSAFAGLSNVVLATDTDSYFGPQAAYNPFTHTWSLGVEEQFYLLFPLLMFHHLRGSGRALRWVVWLTLGSLAISAVLSAVAHRYAFYLIFPRFWELGAGMLLFLTLDRWRGGVEVLPRAKRALLALTGVALVATGFALPESALFPFPLALLPVLGTAVLIMAAVALPGSALARLLSIRPMVATGKLSFSLYLWHWPVFVLFRWTAGIETLPLQVLALGLSCLLAVLSYLLIERPLRTSGRIGAAPRQLVVQRALIGAALAALAGITMFHLHDRISLSVTRDHAVWYADGRRPLDPALSHCAFDAGQTSLAGATVLSWTPRDCTVKPAGFTLFAIGDSHNAAYTPVYRQLAAELGVPVRTWTRAGCPFLKLNEAMDPRGQCAATFAALFADLEQRVKPGDVIFLPALRQTRIINEFGPEDWRGNRPDDTVPQATLDEARRLLQRLSATGAQIVFEAPKPLFASPPFRCADWFNRINPVCAGGFTMPREELMRRAAPVRAAIARLDAEVPGLSVWDPFPVLCPGQTCEALPGGRPLFVDADHLSGHGNDVLYPGLRAAILQAARR